MASTPDTSPPPDMPEDAGKAETENVDGRAPDIEDMTLDERYARLSYLLEKSAIYSRLLKERMDMAKTRFSRDSMSASPAPSSVKHKAKPAKPIKFNPRKRRLAVDSDSEPEATSKRTKLSASPADDGEQEETSADNLPPKFVQPELVTGATLKDYQLEGVAWMVGLFENGISGILADEMGLGKTLQTIAFSAYIREKISGPFLVVCPLSVLHNWVSEYQRFAPGIPVCMYHGNPAERAELRRTVLVPPPNADAPDFSVNAKGKHRAKAAKPKAAAKGAKGRKGGKAKAKAKAAPRRSTRATRNRKAAESEDEEDEEEAIPTDDEEEKPEENQEEPQAEVEEKPEKEDPPEKGEWGDFPVVVTTYEMLIKDQKYLSQFKWGFIVVDEGQRLKNFDCRLMQEIKRYESAGRIVLSGTPLQNNLAELWSLLNFILPDFFNDLDVFQEWFNLEALQNQMGSERAQSIIADLHGILKPFLLRRTKADVEVGLNLPPKKEYVIYVGLSKRQKELYDAIIDGGLRRLLVREKNTSNGLAELDEGTLKEGRRLRSAKGQDEGAKDKKGKRGRKGKATEKFDILDGDDDEYFERLERGEFDGEQYTGKGKSVEELGREWQMKSALRQVNNLRLQNIIMQLRKACSHPYLFDWPLDPRTHAPLVNADLVRASGKMQLLQRLLDALFARGHKALVFSQFTTMLDIMEAWAREEKGWQLCRIDGSTPPQERRDEMERFQSGGEGPNAPRLFLLSTRAGGLGINLTAADTVIFYDQDWNPQMDIQAQDRAHRIGQTKPVLIFRMVTQNTIETRIMQRASAKRQLEALVIARGKYKNPGVAAPKKKMSATMTELAAAADMLALGGEGEEVDVAEGGGISDRELEMLLDRRREVFEERGSGWDSKNGREGKEGARFAVFSGSAEGGSEVLAGMLGERVE
ncbi:hypothetical protein GLOTRDRAFT_117172 [Gloeophyllum trabeum ATCC 11539]|uniref:SNF2 family DNA-dependent ATPase n=1 Tax=Gloeophyllum trabeum (strain ATCC 11539 / FP-39264 / Madison 617) TaxID=670483 RepID=S7RKA1_GLOTA|nr:uncharacterized protein GLOTRDRAFT_117172 [Gloeophyllum trabeum ATCC 11539]EPQ53069.1 hypothetical protein GLOTRDRAFT_117172 [Gloeophyllum trabeum ATCC 11539]